MKKRLFVLLLTLAMLPLSNLCVMAQPIDFGVGYVDPTDPTGDYPRSPILLPEVDIDGYTLTFYTPCDGCVLRLVNDKQRLSFGHSDAVLEIHLADDARHLRIHLHLTHTV